MKCRSCGNTDVIEFLSLGKQPLANNFLKSDGVGKEMYYPLDLVFCTDCTLVQLSDASYVSRDVLFRHYLYASSVSGGLRRHFEDLAAKISEEVPKDGLVVDIGSNDGVLLKPLKALGIRAVGVEPAANLAKTANEQGLDTVNDFFGKDTVSNIVSGYGRADAVTASNVFAHVGDVHDMIENVKLLLKENGFFIVEIQYLIDTITDMTYDNIYHEHVFYYSLRSLIRLFEKHGMRIFKAEHVMTHGGSLRIYTSKDTREFDLSIQKFIDSEREKKIDKIQTYEAFADELWKRIAELRTFFGTLKEKNKTVAAYGAPAKSSTIANSVKLDSSLIQYVVEDALLKQGLLTPGSHIPIVSPAALDERPPDYLVIFAWNYAEDIMRKLEKYRAKGMRCVIPMPKLKIIEPA